MNQAVGVVFQLKRLYPVVTIETNSKQKSLKLFTEGCSIISCPDISIGSEFQVRSRPATENHAFAI